jgi:two-component system response regulator FixJ
MADEPTTARSEVAVREPIVVIVDDDPAVCNSLKFSLELEGFVVRVFGSAAELFHAGELEAYDCFIVDQRMSEVSGLDMIAQLRKRRIATPAILVTSHPSAALSARAAIANVPIVEKPLLGNALLDRVREACVRR